MTVEGPRKPEYASDLVVRGWQEHGVPYVLLNPGASFRGLHDSLVNFAEDDPPILEVPHEKVAVGMAHGYAKVTGTPLAVVTHDLVGLLHATLGVYYAYVDRVPMLLYGGAGPMDQARRRPWIDWIHTANTQNETVRPYTKWDDHPFSVGAIPDAIARAHAIATEQPQGPVYVALDADLQERALAADDPVVAPPTTASSGIAPDPATLRQVADLLATSERPVLVLGYVGRDPRLWETVIELAELVGAGVVDTGLRGSFPNRHHLNVTGTQALQDADVVVLLDVKDIGHFTGLLRKEDRGQAPRLAAEATLADIGFGDLGISPWATHHGRLYRPHIQLLADTSLAVPALLERCRNAVDPAARLPWRQRCRELHDAALERWRSEAAASAQRSPIAVSHLVATLGEAIDGHDWVLTAGTGGGWATRLWDLDRPHRHAGRSLGTATQVGISLGVALAHRDSGRLVVDLQPDGDLLFDTSALWIATRHRIPMLMVMVNNRAYGNDLGHQQHVARERGRPVERANVGIAIDDPPVDFATVARGFGWWAEGPVTAPGELPAVLARAVDVAVNERRPALVDVVCATD